jgi:hypothetical protein
MAFPTSPTDGQIYKDKKYNSTKNVWENVLNDSPVLNSLRTKGFIYTDNAYGIYIGDDTKLVDNGEANTVFAIGQQNADRGYLRFGSTGPVIGGVNGGTLLIGGIPFIDSGSNVNGSYIKFYDGTLIQSGVGAPVALSLDSTGSFSNYSGVGTITFPISFLEVPVITATVRRNNVGSFGSFLSIHALTVSNFGFRETGAAAQAAIGYQWQAIGRWK